ncbi:DUF4389 domain-containing protein [Amycolatopsis sp. FDAARGOS 1241]|uniref:DUF4389 domain-containing protein n=1 Tax=Amycolatopsis sp. FDAARGOS 1241 TaxID=2778070 RepID=UPI0019521A11|nr:DUF4389 domain-containing protein [Amycolatopsis sp. FDAARGOS 1241]QRP50214.1 DUF4389 domain-containing protein [Amycolatopsis sp. FDAARGOS 1241]
MTGPYPVRVEADLDEPLSRWLWLVKWLLAIPHYLVLAVLWFVYPFVGLCAFFAILFTARYPRSLFEYTVGVLRWSWRVQYYGYAALGTDRYPPFTFGDVPSYPARLQVDYPGRLSRGLVLVKWWLLALPHLIIVGFFVGGGSWMAGRDDWGGFWWAAGGLVGILVLIAGVVLLFTGRYPRPVFDFVLGMDRWTLRVAAYVSLLTDAYPPFRMDLGGSEPALPPPPPSPLAGPTTTAEPQGWTPGRVAGAIGGAVVLLVSTGLLTGGAALLWADRGRRDADGYVTGSATFATSSPALVSDSIDLSGTGPDPATLLGTVRIGATASDPAKPVFVGVGTTDRVMDYLAGTEYTTATDLSGRGAQTLHPGSAVAVPPSDAQIWTTESAGPGTQSVTWPAQAGGWTVVVMNADGSDGVSARVDAGATAPALPWLATGVLAVGVLFFAGGVALIWMSARAAARRAPPSFAAG